MNTISFMSRGSFHAPSLSYFLLHSLFLWPWPWSTTFLVCMLSEKKQKEIHTDPMSFHSYNKGSSVLADKSHIFSLERYLFLFLLSVVSAQQEESVKHLHQMINHNPKIKGDVLVNFSFSCINKHIYNGNQWIHVLSIVGLVVNQVRLKIPLVLSGLITSI